MRVLFVVLAGWASCFAGPSDASPFSAGEVGYSKEYHDCIARSGLVDSRTSDCEGDEFVRQDAELNLAYRSMVGAMDPAKKLTFQKAERAWIAFRDAQCEFESSNDATATFGPLVYNSCRTRLTYERKQELLTRPAL
jgi:uncharacterized protein YecT (DUF1311 family)